MRKELVERTFMLFNELSVKDQEKEVEKAVQNNDYYDDFSFEFYQEYLHNLNDIQEKYDLNLEPIFSNGRHSLLGFQCLDNGNDNKEIFYKNIYFFIDTYDNIVDFYYDKDKTEKNNSIKIELQFKVDNFIKDFMGFYVIYEYYFMYGGCEQYDEYVKESLEYFNVEFLVSVKVLENEQN